MPPPEPPEIDIKAPPVGERTRGLEFSVLLMGVITGAATALTIGVVGHQSVLLAISLLVVACVLATPFIQRASARRTANRSNDEAFRRYLDHLADRGRLARQAVAARRAFLESVHPTPDQLMTWIGRLQVWQRRPADADFLDVALGQADIPSGLTVRLGENDKSAIGRFGELKTRAAEVADAARTITDAPFVLSIAAEPVLSIEGPPVDEPREHVLGLARAILLELLVCCGPDDLSLFVAAPAITAADWAWTTLVPHAAYRPDGDQAIIATTGPMFSRALARLAGSRLQALGNREDPGAAALPRLVIVIDAFDTGSELIQIPQLNELLAQAGSAGVSVLLITNGRNESPPETTAEVIVQPDRHATARLVGRSQARAFYALSSPELTARQVAAQLSDHRRPPPLPDENANRPLLDLLGMRPLPATSPTWRRLSEHELLRATIGVTSGDEFALDLKESDVGGYGPHGLLVGAPGSGKSQLLRSLVISLALTHSPEQLRMVFIDFKGGSALKPLADLPHSAGIITNIEDNLALIERMRESLPAEIEARQRLLDRAGADDIRGYWALRENRPELNLTPMPYLLVIIDEFGRLLNHDDGFLKRFLEAGQVGRSLGVHLMLSSQRLESRAGELVNYAGYRIALRTFTTDDSLAAIESREAYTLPQQPGYGYFKAGGVLVRFKAAPVGVSAGDGQTDMDRVLRWMSAIPKAPQLWLDPLPDTADGEILPLDDDRLAARPADGGLPVVVGLWDDPARRRQGAAVFDTTREGGHVAVVGKPGSGKSAAMLTQVLQAARTYDANRLRFLIIDGSDRLAVAASLPNVAGYASMQDEDRVVRIVTDLSALLAQRARALADGAALPGWPQTVLIIDNYRAFQSRYAADLEPVVERLLLEGSGFGLHVHLTSVRWADISDSQLQRITTRIELSLEEPTSSRHRPPAKAAAITESGPGRGLGAGGLQWQLAAPLLSACPLPRAADREPSDDGGRPSRRRRVSIPGDLIAKTAAAVADQARTSWPGVSAPPLLLLKDLSGARFDQVVGAAATERAVLGVYEDGFQPVFFQPGQSGNLIIQGDLASGREALERILCQCGAGVDLYLIDFRGDLTTALGPVVRAAARTPDDVETVITDVRRLLDERRSAHQDSRRLGSGTDPIALVIDNYETVHEHTTAQCRLACWVMPRRRLCPWSGPG